MKISRIIAKSMVRVFFILLFIALLPVFEGHQSKLQHIYLTFRHKWEMVFPLILVVAFIGLWVICTIKKYQETDMNWLLVLNTLILIVYGIAIYIHIYHFIG